MSKPEWHSMECSRLFSLRENYHFTNVLEES